MKSIKKLSCAFLTMLLLASAISPVMANNNIKVRLGGELIKFDVQPQLVNNRTMVPLRAIFEALGATVDWNGDTQTVTSTKDGTTISLSINNPTMYVNGEAVILDSPACLVNGRTLVPVRAISEAFKLQVEWIDSTKTVRIKKETSLMSESCFYGVTWSYTYDDNGREIERKNIAYPEIYVNSEYDVDGSLIKENYTADGSSITYEYDKENKLISSTNSYSEYTQYEYDKNGNLTYKYDNTGNYVKLSLLKYKV